MNDRRRDDASEIHRWEKLPAIALGISQGLNIFLWYIMSLERVSLTNGTTPIRVPDFVVTFLPLAVFVAAVAAAVSLDGTMIAAVAGSRSGRDGRWTWITVVAAALFSAGIALDVYGGNILPGAWLHIAQTAVLLCYMMHLRQRRKALQDGEMTVRNRSGSPILAKKASTATDRVTVPIADGFHCKVCDHISDTLADASRHARDAHPRRSASPAAWLDVAENAVRQNGTPDV